MSQQIADLKTIAQLMHALSSAKERDFEKMALITSSQHQAVMKLTKIPESSLPEQELYQV
jgi:hypothetical protein